MKESRLSFNTLNSSLDIWRKIDNNVQNDPGKD